MITYENIRLFVWLVGVPVILFLLWNTVRRVRAIRELDARLREEEAQNARNPYADMAQMYEARELLERARRGK